MPKAEVSGKEKREPELSFWMFYTVLFVLVDAILGDFDFLPGNGQG